VTFVFPAEVSMPAGGLNPAWRDYSPSYYISGDLNAEEILEGVDAIYADLLE
jgi:hypothetical protein